MKERRFTGIALAKKDERGICILYGVEAWRRSLKNEKNPGEDPYVALVNAKTLHELMLAYEQIRLDDAETPFVSGHCVVDPQPVTYEDVRGIYALFGDERPTKTAAAKIRDAIDVWSMDNIVEGSGELLETSDGERHRLFNCTPLSIMIEALDDLRRHALLLSWLVGKTDFASAHGLPVGDRGAKFKKLGDAGEKDLASYYGQLEEAPGNYQNGINANIQIQQMHLYEPAMIERDLACYVASVFDLLMSDDTRKLDRDLRPYMSCNTLIAAAWTRFAKGVSQEDGSGALGICRRCGKFFEQQRNTKQYCSESCRVMATRDRAEGILGRPDPEPTEVSKRRAEQRRHAAEERAHIDAAVKIRESHVASDGTTHH